MNASYYLANDISIEIPFTIELAFDEDLMRSLEKSLFLAQERLQKFSNNADFSTQLAVPFGDANLESLQTDWQQDNFSILSQIEIRTNIDLNGAFGAYGASTDRIYLSQEFLQANQNNIELIADVILEEAGHRIDSKLNSVDSAGDEGAIFSALLSGKSLNTSDLQSLKTEDDSAILALDGQAIFVEQSLPNVPNTDLSVAARDPFLRTLYTEGRFLYDSSGQKVILRGVNLSVLDDYSFPQTNPTSKLDEVAKSGANAVRIQWYVDYGQANRPAYTVQDLDNFLAACTAKGIIPILTLFDATFQDIGLLNSKLMPWWTSAPVVAVLKKYEQHLIINLGNEVGLYRFAGETPQALDAFRNAYKTAITSIRQQGLDLPIMIDAPDGGSTLGIFNTIGQELVNHDPDRNIILSAHAYWAGYNGVPQIQPAINANLPIFFGEVANSQDEFINGTTQYGYYDLDGSGERNPPLNGSTYTYQALLTSLKQSEIGWLAWAWWQDFDARRQLATNGNFATLTPYGNNIINNPTYGLQATAQRSTIFVTTFNGTNGNDALTGTAGNDAIKPLRGTDTVNGGTGTDLLVIDYSSNLYTGAAPQIGIVSSLVSNGGGSFNGSYTAYFNSTNFDRVSFSNIERFVIIGTATNDNILTADGNDFLYGGTGIDTLTGGIGNDYLDGGDGNDILIGANPNSINSGRGEVDTLIGGVGNDRFILGDSTWIGYDDGNTAVAGNNDYAVIIGFNSIQDKVQLKGAAGEYLLVVSGANTNLLIDKPGGEPDELIAIFQNITGLNLASGAFEYVGGNPNTPNNDNFANAIALTGNTAGITGSNIGATGEFNEPLPVDIDVAPLNSVWWKWTAPSNGNVTINTAGSNFDTVLGVYVGNAIASGLTTIAVNDDVSGATTSSVTFSTTGGTTYQISVDGYQAQTGSINLGLLFTNTNFNTDGIKADFNGDGKDDIFFRDPVSGQNAFWLMNGIAPTVQTLIASASSNFSVLKAGDFNNDRKDDIFFRDPVTGQNAIWLMDGISPIVQTFIPSGATNFSVQKIGDFNGDRKADIFFRDPVTGQNALWLMDGVNPVVQTLIPSGATNFSVQKTGDFNGDGKADVFFRDPLSGQNALWLMDGVTPVVQTLILPGATNFDRQFIGDFNGDRKDDILFRNPTTGENGIWLMDGVNVISQSLIPPAGTNFSIVDTGDYSGDGKADILFRDQFTGQNAIWLMNGTAPTLQSFIPEGATNFQIVGA